VFFGKGTVELDVKFDKNVFFGNEVCTADVSINNKECSLRINSVSFTLQQRLHLNINGMRYSKVFDVIKNLD
jgi:hypothetical protein